MPSNSLHNMPKVKPIYLILFIYSLFATNYNLLTPVFEAGDELWHYPMVEHLANGNPLPIQVFDPNEVGLWKQQASQPPLYYYLGAIVTAFIDTTDMVDKRWLNPHVNNGIITADGNTNLTIHNPDWNPFSGTLLAVRMVRFLSITLGLITVYYTWKIGQLTHPERPMLALSAASMVAFLPMFLFVSSAVNNDNLIITLSAITLYYLIRYVVILPSVHWKEIIMLGFLIGMATISKIIGVGLLPLALGTLFIANWRDHKHTKNIFSLLVKTAGQFIVLFAVTVTVGGWWYMRNIQLYGDWKGWNAFIAVLGQRPQTATLAQLWDERFGFMQSFWGLFGGVNIPLPTMIYTVLNMLLIIGIVGFIFYTLHLLSRFRVTNHSTLLTSLFNLVEQHFALVICLVWTTAVIFGLIQWATITWSSQGRLVFAALPAEMILLTTGLFGWIPHQKISRLLITSLMVFMSILAIFTPWAIIRPNYHYMEKTVPNEHMLDIDPITFGDHIQLKKAAIDTRLYEPNTSVDLYIEWEIIEESDRDWSVFIHLNDPIINNPISQRDMYLGNGLLATSLIEKGLHIRDHYQLHIPATTIAPSQLQLFAGIYDYETGERLGASTPLTTIMVTPPISTLPNPTQANFGNKFELIGYKLSTRIPKHNESFDVTLYFKTHQEIMTDYMISAQILPKEVNDTTRYGSHDLPLNTTTWQPKQIQEIKLSLKPIIETPSDVYRLVLKAYTQKSGTFTNLHLSEDGRLTNNTDLTLSKIRVIDD